MIDTNAPKNLHFIVQQNAELATEMFQPSFLAQWLTMPVVSTKDVSHPDEFGMFMAGGPL